MYALKTIFDDCREKVNFLGNDYDLFYKTDKSDDEFSYYFKDLFPKPEINDIANVVAIISNGEMMIPLYRHFTYYIVTSDNGQTFKKLSWYNLPK